ncbi:MULTISPECIES: YceI family protein [unclassified Tenacibaculum]|uniref:YceI family protein n=1 Tax=unclassified Tenacibaculum TaxID=2635139 RepID=UPI001F2D4E50|nr:MULTISPECIES: YceI family protein [unclassified Tenacibaculum]MCF2874098.1 YceI family protein [Tenacibaculum sp. Cn5-1]MCF2934679.1 YceI family protein [Tenacibaculum sp. Cn5-34]MCG7510889.1 YceI family protein [Tenacibaculum sp. Cn5-46]
MKYFYSILLIAFLMLSCKNNKENQAENKATLKEVAQTTETILSGNKSINIDKSTIIWKGHKILGSHTGEIKLKSAGLTFNNGTLTKGSFIVDMNTIKAVELMKDGDDDEEEEEENNEGEEHDDRDDLANHLKNEDFFDANKYPEATFTIKQATKNGDSYKITGDMTIKEITKEIAFDAIISGQTLKSHLKINRTDFGIKYGSGSFFKNLGDNIIKDQFDLIISLVIE